LIGEAASPCFKWNIQKYPLRPLRGRERPLRGRGRERPLLGGAAE